MKNSNKIIVLTHSMKAYIHGKYNFDKNNIFVIPCYVDNELFKFIDNNNFNLRNKLNINTKSKIICYLGSVSGMYLVDEMLDFFINLKNKHYEYYFLFITKNIHELNPKI